MSGTRRSWKVRWYDPHWADMGGASYATRERALARGMRERDEGCFDVQVWESDEKGYMVPDSAFMVKDLRT